MVDFWWSYKRRVWYWSIALEYDWCFFQCACYQIQLDLVGVFLLNKDCPDGWQHNNHSCYKIFTNDVGITWPEANRKCNQQNGSLVSIASKQELEYVHHLVTNSLDLIWDKQMFIGLSLNNCERGLISPSYIFTIIYMLYTYIRWFRLVMHKFKIYSKLSWEWMRKKKDICYDWNFPFVVKREQVNL